MVLRSVRFSMSGWNADDRIWSLYMSHFIYYFTYLGLLVCWRVSYSFHVKIITLRVMIIVFVCAYVYVLSYNCWMNNFSNHLFILYCVCFKSFREVHVLLVASHIWFLLKFFICGLMLLSLSLDWWWLIQFHRLSRFVEVHQKLTPLLIPVFFYLPIAVIHNAEEYFTSLKFKSVFTTEKYCYWVNMNLYMTFGQICRWLTSFYKLWTLAILSCVKLAFKVQWQP